MADDVTKNVLSVIATVSDRVKDLVIKNGQLIFVQDKHRIALDFGGVRKFYNQIVELDTDVERTSLSDPENGLFYFIIDTAVLWRYDNNEWVKITTSPEEVIFIGVELPTLGSANKLYVNKGEQSISVWDEETGKYVTVADYTNEITEEDIESLFI